jgi:hypothetical protein
MQREHNYNVPYTSTAALASQILKLTTKQPRSLFNPNLRSNGGKEAMVTAEFFFTSGPGPRRGAAEQRRAHDAPGEAGTRGQGTDTIKPKIPP